VSERLLVVTDAFAGRGSGILVMPRITVPGPSAPIQVRLRRPDGSERVVTASFDLAHMRGPNGQFAMYRLHDVGVDDVPNGTELWSDP
jgi:hypothetical protein